MIRVKGLYLAIKIPGNNKMNLNCSFSYSETLCERGTISTIQNTSLIPKGISI